MTEWQPPVILALQRGAALLRDGDRCGDFRSAAFRAAFDFYLDLFRRGLAPRAGAGAGREPLPGLRRGVFAFYVTGPWNLGEFARRLPRSAVPWATAPMPAPDGDGPGVSLAGGASLAIFRGSPRKDAAWQLGRVPRRAGAAARVLPPDRRSAGAPERVARPRARRPTATRRRSGCSSSTCARRRRSPSGSASPTRSRGTPRAAIRGERRRRRGARRARPRRRRDPREAALDAAREGRDDRERRSVSARRRLDPGLLLRRAGARCAIVVFFFVPVAASLLLSFTDFDIYAVASWRQPALRRARATTRRLLRDPLFWMALRNTLYFVVVGGPLSIARLARRGAAAERAAGALARASSARVLLPAGRDHAGRRRGRVALRLPPALRAPEPAARRARLGPIDWLGDPRWAMPAIILMAVWKNFGFNMVIFVAGAAEHSRAASTRRRASTARARWQQFRHVTLPMLAPTLLFVAVMTMIGYFQLFAEPYVMTQGGPANSTLERRAADVRGGLPLVEHGLRRGDRVRAVRHHPRADARAARGSQARTGGRRVRRALAIGGAARGAGRGGGADAAAARSGWSRRRSCRRARRAPCRRGCCRARRRSSTTATLFTRLDLGRARRQQRRSSRP